MMIKWSIHQENLRILSFYVPNNRVSKYMKQKRKELQGGIGKSTIIVRDFDITLLIIDKTSRNFVKL